MHRLVIAEKPEIGRAVADALPERSQSHGTYITCGDWTITWCYGHLLRLKEPEDYGEAYSRKNTPNEKLPIFFANWEMKVPEPDEKGRSKKPQLDLIGTLLKNADAVVHAGDIDDEGQLLVEEVLEWHKYKGPVYRLNTSALDVKSMKQALAGLEDNVAWHPLALSARARSVGDLMVGVNMSRFFTNLYHANLSIGRVQTPTLGLVVTRDEIIEQHVKQVYYLLDMDAALNAGQGTHQVRFVPASDNPHLQDGMFMDRTYLDKLAAGVTGKEFQGTVTKEAVLEKAPLPFNVNRLKIYCSEKYNLAPEQTLQITQTLREKYKIITYNRSDCEYLPENMFGHAPGIVNAVVKNLGKRWEFTGLDTNQKSRAFNDKALNGYPHHAIIPTEQTVDISLLTAAELNVYRAICGYFFAQFMPPCEKERTRLTIPGSQGNKFEAKSIRILKPGFKAIMRVGNESEDVQTPLAQVPAGTYTCKLDNPVIADKETKPPARYTEASLEDDMTKIAKYVKDKQVKAILLQKDAGKKGELGSIGTAATRSQIIGSLKKKGYLETHGKQIVSTELARKFFHILPPEIQQPNLTAKWWLVQEQIKAGEATPEDLYANILSDFKDLAAKEYPAPEDISFLSPLGTRKELGKCPLCGQPVVETKLGYGCSGYKAGCKFALWKEGKFGVGKVLTENKKKLTATMAEKLLKGKKVAVYGLHSAAKNKDYNAWLVLDEHGYLAFDFTDPPNKKRK